MSIEVLDAYRVCFEVKVSYIVCTIFVEYLNLMSHEVLVVHRVSPEVLNVYRGSFESWMLIERV